MGSRSLSNGFENTIKNEKIVENYVSYEYSFIKEAFVGLRTRVCRARRDMRGQGVNRSAKEPTKQMHVLITVNASWNVANFRRGLIEALLADGHRITVLAPIDEHSQQLVEMGCRFIPLEMKVQGLSPPRDMGLLLRFLRHFRRERPDMVFSYTIKNNIFGALAARMLGIPFVPTITGLGTAFLSGPLLQGLAEFLYRISFRSVREVFFQNSDDRDFFLERGLITKDKALLVGGSGADLAHFSMSEIADSGRGVTFLMIGRVLRDKGVLEYINAARLVKKDYPRAHFMLLGKVGADNRSAISAETVKEWVDEGIVCHIDYTDDVRPVIAKAECVVLPSYREGAPRTLLEGAAMGRPIITTDVPGCRQVVEDGRTGFLCEARSSKSLRDAMVRFIKLSHRRRVEMGRAGREKIERQFSERAVIDAYRQSLTRIVGGSHGGKGAAASTTFNQSIKYKWGSFP